MLYLSTYFQPANKICTKPQMTKRDYFTPWLALSFHNFTKAYAYSQVHIELLS